MSMAMMLMTTRSSMRVKPCGERTGCVRGVCGVAQGEAEGWQSLGFGALSFGSDALCLSFGSRRCMQRFMRVCQGWPDAITPGVTG